jgi:hypothetical protein
MTKKTYIAIAKIVKETTRVNVRGDESMLPTINKVAMVSELCTLFKSDNSLFDRARFIDACDVVDD